MNDLNTACFLSAARTKNFSATAKELSITQQAVSRSIRKMEQELGFPLFIRNSQSMELSKGGEYYYNWLTTLDESLSWASMHFGDYAAGGGQVRFRIAFCDWIGDLPPMLRAAERLKHEHPELIVEYLTGPAADTFGFVEKGSADIVILPETAAFYITGYPDTYISIPFHLAHLNAYCSHEFCDDAGRPDREALARRPLILSPLGGQTEDTVVRAAAEWLGLGKPPEILRVPNLDSVYMEALCGAGYTISPENPVVRRCRGLQSEALPVTIPIVAMWLQNRRVPWSPIFTELLAQEVRQA